MKRNGRGKEKEKGKGKGKENDWEEEKTRKGRGKEKEEERKRIGKRKRKRKEEEKKRKGNEEEIEKGVNRSAVLSRLFYFVQRNVGRFPSGLATNYPIMIGRKPHSRHVFRGRIACLQLFNVALTRPQIIALKKKCFRPSKCYQQLRDLVHFIELFQLLFLQVYFIILLM